MRQFTGYIRGINLGGWLSQCDHRKEHHDTFITENDINKISSWGLDHVRLPVDYELVQTEHGDFIEDGFAYIDNCLNWCEKYGLNMILDLHKARGYYCDEFETSDFFHSSKLQEDFINLWVEFSKRYGKYYDRLSFELLNEVVDRNVAQLWNGIIGRTIKGIRKYVPSIHILVGGVESNSILTLEMLSAPYDENIVYNFHFYEPLIFTHQSAYWIKEMPTDFYTKYPNRYSEFKAESERNLPPVNLNIYENYHQEKVEKSFFETLFANAVRIAEERNTLLYCGEYGVIDRADLTSTLNWYADINSTFEKYGIPRAAWTYKGKDFGITEDHYAPILNQLIKFISK